MLSVNTNLSSLIAQNSLNSSTDALNLAIERMTTGYKINHAKDNAANYAIAAQMSSQLSSYEVAANNVAMGMDLVTTADSIINNMQTKASRLHSLCVQARNGTYGAQSLNAINTEVSALVSEIVRVYNTAEYNNISLFNNKANDIPSYLPKAGANGFIDSAAVDTVGTTDKPVAKYNGFIEEVVEETPDVVVTNPTDLKTAIQNNTKIGIANAETLAQLATLVNDEGINCSGKTIILTEDINLSSISNWRAIGSGQVYQGDFNGNGHTISGLTITSRNPDTLTGLFGEASGDIKNLGLKNVNINLNDNDFPVGGLVGVCYGNIQNCYLTGSITTTTVTHVGGLSGICEGELLNCYTDANVIGVNSVGGLAGQAGVFTNCYSTGDVTGQGDYIGGLVGSSIGAITNCYATGDVISNAIGGEFVGGLAGSAQGAITYCYATGNIAGDSLIGGLVGQTTSMIANCYSTGNINGDGLYQGGLVGDATSIVTNCYATGGVKGGAQAGGLIGSLSGEVINCYATGSVKGGERVGGLIGGSSGEVINCYATGNVCGLAYSAWQGGLVGHATSTVTNCYATGDIIGAYAVVGGLVGHLDGSISNSYAMGNVEGEIFVGGLVGEDGISAHSYSNSIAFGSVKGSDITTTGSFIGSGTPGSITNCQAKEQGIDKIGSCTDDALLANITEVEIYNVATSLQVGINSDLTSQIEFDTNFTFDLSALTADITSDQALDCIMDFIDLLSAKSTELGAVNNRLESALESISVNIENLTSSRSTIKDADIAKVSSEYIRQQILQQASATLLSTANQSPSIALQLI